MNVLNVGSDKLKQLPLTLLKRLYLAYSAMRKMYL